MTFEAYAFDTGWLKEQELSDMASLARVLAAIERMRAMRFRVLLDHEGAILKEYDKNLTSGTMGRTIFSHISKFQMAHFVSGSQTSRCSKCLDVVGFDIADRPFVGVAQRGRGAYVTHEAKHLERRRVEAILRCCGVMILGTEDFLESLGV